MKRHLSYPSSTAARRTGGLAVALALSLAAAGVWAGSSPATPSAARCTEGMATMKGADVRVFCGPARATVKFAGKTYHIKSGRCQKASGGGFGIAFVLNVGLQQLPPPSPSAPAKFSYFGVDLEKAKGGTYTNQAIGISIAGKPNLSPLENKVVVSKNLKKGTFTGRASLHANGKLLRKTAPISGSWTC
jgi:hypothetical protein